MFRSFLVRVLHRKIFIDRGVVFRPVFGTSFADLEAAFLFRASFILRTTATFLEPGAYAAAGLSASAFPSAPGPESMPLALVSRSTNSITATGAESP